MTVNNLTSFDLDSDGTIYKKLIGQVNDSGYENICKSTTGQSNLSFRSSMKLEDIKPNCEKFLDAYGRDDYKTKFPNMFNLYKVKDRDILKNINCKLFKKIA